MADHGYMAKIGVDTSGLRNSLREINTDLRSTDTELHKVNSSIKKAERSGTESAELLSQKDELLKKAIDETAEKLEKLRSVEERMKNAHAANSDWEKAYEPLKREIDETKKKLEELCAKNEKMKSDLSSGKISAEQYEEYQKEVQDTADALKALGQKKKELEAQFADGHISDEEYREYQRELANTEAQLRQYRIQLEQTHQEESNSGSGQVVTASLNDVRSALRAINDDIKWFTDNIGKAAKKLGDLAVSAGKYTLDSGMAFEQSMSKVKAYSGASEEALAQLEAAAKKAGAETSRTASESAEALGFMSLAGWDTKEMLDGLMPILRASEAGTADLAATSDLVTDSMSAMGLATSDLTHYLDICTAAQSNSNTTLTGLLEAYTGCGGTLRNLNVPLEESATLLGTLANRGIKASEAGTSLNSVLINLMGANRSAREAMESLGVSAWDADGNFKGVTETLRILDGALADCTEEQKALFEAKIGGKTQMDTLQALINGLNDEYTELNETLVNCDGALESTSATMRDNLTGSVTEMKSALEGLAVNFYQYLEEPAKKGTEAVTQSIRDLTGAMSEGELAEKLRELSEKASELMIQLADLAASKGIPAIIDGLSDLIDLLGWMADNLGTVTALVEGFGAAFVALKLGKTAADIAILVTTITSLAAAAETGSVAAQVLGVALNAIPCVAIAAALVGVTVALSSLARSAGEARLAASAMKTETDKNIIKFGEEVAALTEVSEEMDRSSEKIDRNCEKARDLWSELQTLCDEQGNVCGEQERAQGIISELNTLIDTNITMVDGQIQGYTDLSATMEDYIKNLQRTAKLEAMHGQYVEAVNREDELHENTENAKKKVSDAKAKLSNAQTARTYGGITDVSGLGVDWEELARTTEWKDFAWARKAQGIIVDPTDYDDYLDFLAYMQQQAENEEYIARKAEEANEGVKKKYEDLYFEDSSPKNIPEKKPENETADSGNDEPENISEKAEAELKALDDKLRTQQIPEETYYSELETIISKYRAQMIDHPDSKFWDYVSRLDSHKKNSASNNTVSENKTSGGGKKTDSGKSDTNNKKKEPEDKSPEEETEIEPVSEEAVSAAEKQFDDLQKLYADGEINYEEFVKRYTELQKQWSENSIDISSHTSSELQKIDDEEKKRLEKKIADWEEEGRQLEKQRDELEKRKRDIADKYTSGALYKTVTDKDGGQRKVFDDLSERTEKIKQYNENIKKLSSIKNIPPDLLDELDSMNFDERSEVVEELLKMSDTNRQNYFKDYTEFKNAAAELAEYETQGEQDALDEQEKLHLQSKPEDAYNAGKEDAEAYMRGITDVMKSVPLLFESGIIEKAVQAPQRFTQKGAEKPAPQTSGEKYISVKQPLVFNIAGTEIIRTTIGEILSGNGLTGRANSRL